MTIRKQSDCRLAKTRGRLLSAVSLCAFFLGAPAALAQETPTPTPSPTPAEPERDPPGTIVVIGDRAIIASLKDLEVEQTYDEDDVGSYAAGSVGEVLDAIREENGDENPTLLVNGRPVVDRSDIADLPPEAIQRIETLPRGAAQRVNGAAGQRAYNVVLKRQVRTAVVTASDEIATDGGWSNKRGSLQLTRIKGQNRLNLSLNVADSGYLLESERPYVPRTQDTYYAPAGNVLPGFGSTEVSPVLSALAGRPVFSVALPMGVTSPTLAGLLPGANALNPSGRGDFRSLRSASQPISLSVSGNRELNETFSLSFNANAGWSENRSLSGLARARVTVPTGNVFSPFQVPVSLYLEDPDRPLHSRSRSNSQGVSATLNALAGNWRGSLNARFDRRESNSAYEFSGVLAAVGTMTNPFDGSLVGQIPVTSNRSGSATRTTAIATETSGPLATLWAGKLEGRLTSSIYVGLVRGHLEHKRQAVARPTSARNWRRTFAPAHRAGPERARDARRQRPGVRHRLRGPRPTRIAQTPRALAQLAAGQLAATGRPDNP